MSWVVAAHCVTRPVLGLRLSWPGAGLVAGPPPPAAMSMSTSSRGAAKRQETSLYGGQQHQVSQNYDPESDQSILDEHCSKVFDHTPVRGRSPPTERSKKVKAHKGSGSYMTWSKGQQAYGGFQGERIAF